MSKKAPVSMPTCSTLQELIAVGEPSRPAISAAGMSSLTFGALRSLVGRTIAALNGFGIGRHDRVAIVLPNGPEMAAAFIAIGSGAAAAPLNPSYRADEFKFYITDLRAKALIVEAGSESPAIAVASQLGLRIMVVQRDHAGAGSFTLTSTGEQGACIKGFALPDETALILHTSGTTSRPKIVPLSQRNVSVSAASVAETLKLSSTDRGLNVMPLFHIHGLIAGLLAPLSRGSSVFCASAFNALKFFSWMDEAKPSWYTAVPTMHQAILARAGHNKDIIVRNSLRFIRSSSSSMPPQVIAGLEATFHAPLIEAYGMTEAAHQMASNPVAGRRKAGSVGLAAGPEIAIMDETGRLLPRNTTGEIVIRGANVTVGYENNPEANAAAFTNGWFRTGDQGLIDDDGYVSLTGRLKEIINRGGEKVAPREVDEVLMDHPAVLQVVTFAMPHDKLGEEVAAAVVLRDGMEADEKELRTFAARRLASFKVPRKILILSEIPKGATGKLQRIGLAQKLGV